jgi:CRISPR-associated regulatory protein, DevR family
MENKLKVQGFYLIDVDVVALNNTGKNMLSNLDNGIATKSIIKNGKNYVYVSGQAIRYWWRDTLQKNYNWKLSPIIKKEKVAYTNTNPIEYPDDDVFGYMKAATEETTNEKGKKMKENITVTRISPLKNSAIVSVCAVHPVERWSSMTRQEGDSVPYTKQEYSAIMKGMFSLDLNMLGTFSNYNKSGFQNISEKLKNEALEKGAIEINDDYIPNQRLIQLPLAIRQQRAIDTIKALKNISGGAMQTSNMGDITPKFIVLATTNTGNHPFSHIVKSQGERNNVAVLNIDGLKEVIEEYKDNYRGKIFIGKRKGFFDDENEVLKKLQEEYKDLIEYGPVNAIIDAYCEQLKQQMV